MKTIAIIGCGRIANGAHLPALSKLDNVRIKYACDLKSSPRSSRSSPTTTLPSLTPRLRQYSC